MPLLADPDTGRVVLVAAPPCIPQHRHDLQAALDAIDAALDGPTRAALADNLTLLRRFAGLED